MAPRQRRILLLSALLGSISLARLDPRIVERLVASPSSRKDAVAVALIVLWAAAPPLAVSIASSVVQERRWSRFTKVAVAALVGGAAFGAAVIPRVIPTEAPPHVARPSPTLLPILFLGAVVGVAQLWRSKRGRCAIGFAGLYLLLALGAIGAALVSEAAAKMAFAFDRPFLAVQVPIVGLGALAAAVLTALRRSNRDRIPGSMSMAGRVLILLAVTGSLLSRSLPHKIAATELGFLEAVRRLPDHRLLIYAVWPKGLDIVTDLIAFPGTDGGSVRPLSRRPKLIETIPWAADPVVSASGDRVRSLEIAPPWMWLFSVVGVDQVLDTHTSGREIVRLISVFRLEENRPWRWMELGTNGTWIAAFDAKAVVRLKSGRRLRIDQPANADRAWFDGPRAAIPRGRRLTFVDVTSGARRDIEAPDRSCDWLRPPDGEGGVAVRCGRDSDRLQRWLFWTGARGWSLAGEEPAGVQARVLWDRNGRPVELISTQRLCSYEGGREFEDDFSWSDFREMKGKYYAVHYAGMHGAQDAVAELDRERRSVRILPTWGFDAQLTDGVIIATGADQQWGTARLIDPASGGEGLLFAMPFHWPPLPASSSSAPASPD